MKQNLLKWGTALLAASPLLAAAQDVGGNLEEFVETAQTIINSLVPIFMTLALLYFIWGLIMYIKSAGNPDEAKKGKSIMIWGVVALFVMASVWGLTAALQDIFGIDNVQAPDPDDLIPGGF